jgi:taurine--2-oxoglutarate transaminase
VVNREIADFLGDGRWASVSTNSGHPLAVAAIAANIELIRDENVLEHVTELGLHFGERLNRMVEDHPCAEAASGRGFGWALELIKDADTGEKWVPRDRWLTPGVDPEPQFRPGQFIVDECEKDGILLFNFLPNTVTLAPPLKISQADLDLALDSIDRALTKLDELTAQHNMKGN